MFVFHIVLLQIEQLKKKLCYSLLMYVVFVCEGECILHRLKKCVFNSIVSPRHTHSLPSLCCNTKKHAKSHSIKVWNPDVLLCWEEKKKSSSLFSSWHRTVYLTENYFPSFLPAAETNNATTATWQWGGVRLIVIFLLSKSIRGARRLDCLVKVCADGVYQEAVPTQLNECQNTARLLYNSAALWEWRMAAGTDLLPL